MSEEGGSSCASKSHLHPNSKGLSAQKNAEHISSWLTEVLEAKKASSLKVVQDFKAEQMKQLMTLCSMSSDDEEKPEAMFTTMIKRLQASFFAPASTSKTTDDQEP